MDPLVFLIVDNAMTEGGIRRRRSKLAIVKERPEPEKEPRMKEGCE